jgi:hypothetical protein
MKIKEIYDIDQVWNEIDDQFNPENSDARHDEEERYQRIAAKSKGETPVITKEPAEELHWSNDPHDNPDDEFQTPGYRGGENAKQRSGVKFKQYDRPGEHIRPMRT